MSKANSILIAILGGVAVLAYFYREKLFGGSARQSPQQSPRTPNTGTAGFFPQIFSGINPNVPSFNPGGAAPRGSGGATGGAPRAAATAGIDASGLIGLLGQGINAARRYFTTRQIEQEAQQAAINKTVTASAPVGTVYNPATDSYDFGFSAPSRVSEDPSSYYFFPAESVPPVVDRSVERLSGLDSYFSGDTLSGEIGSDFSAFDSF